MSLRQAYIRDSFDWNRADTQLGGRRLRTFAGLSTRMYTAVPLVDDQVGMGVQRLYPLCYAAPGGWTWEILLDDVTHNPNKVGVRHLLNHLPLRINENANVLYRVIGVPSTKPSGGPDAELFDGLQDLANEINEDIREALYTLDSPSMPYLGVDEGIDPVSDDHVALVIWALQRELNRERRNPLGSFGGGTLLPAPPLDQLQPRVQRALAERRRLRYAQWGINRADFEANRWSLWNVPPDDDYVPRRAMRVYGDTLS